MAGALGNFWPSAGRAEVSSRRVRAETYLFPVSPECPATGAWIFGLKTIEQLLALPVSLSLTFQDSMVGGLLWEGRGLSSSFKVTCVVICSLKWGGFCDLWGFCSHRSDSAISAVNFLSQNSVLLCSASAGCPLARWSSPALGRKAESLAPPVGGVDGASDSEQLVSV